MWEVGGAAEPVVVGVDVGEGYYLAAFESGMKPVDSAWLAFRSEASNPKKLNRPLKCFRDRFIIL